ncbi:hypothetical protein SAMN05444280_1211 [Tangfeifania diversioriginum]|uniref:Uncharacterized protein n=1 Tax=Tangfeifania diversioriginum TaxID=1168035 RepID=A0A1M6JR93_9BACT|nr:hypothetical protein SAMN05444280_1211 [Tangfeifania diversioriginum]
MVKLLIINLLSRFLKYKKLPVIRQTALTELTSTAKLTEMLFLFYLKYFIVHFAIV